MSLDDIRRAVTIPDAVDVVESAFRTQGHGGVVQPAPMGLDLIDGQVHVKAAQLGPDRPVVIKVATGFANNTLQGLSTGDGAIIVLDPRTGHLQAVLMDRGWLVTTPGIVVPSTAAEAVAGADVVITTTRSRTPILRGEWLNDRALVIAVGADSIGKRECDDTVLRRTTRFVPDNSDQSAQLGELQHLPHDCRSTPAVELGALLARDDHSRGSSHVRVG